MNILLLGHAPPWATQHGYGPMSNIPSKISKLVFQRVGGSLWFYWCCLVVHSIWFFHYVELIVLFALIFHVCLQNIGLKSFLTSFDKWMQEKKIVPMKWRLFPFIFWNKILEKKWRKKTFYVQRKCNRRIVLSTL